MRVRGVHYADVARSPRIDWRWCIGGVVATVAAFIGLILKVAAAEAVLRLIGWRL